MNLENRKDPMLLHADANRKTLVFCLKFFFAIWFFRYLLDPLQLLSELPLGYANPIGPLRLLPVSVLESLYSESGLLLIRFGLLAACVGVWVRPLRSHFALAGCILLTLAAAITRSFGHINHAEIGPILVTWVLTLFYLKLPPEKQSNCPSSDSTASTALITATLLLSLIYAFVGIARICDGGWQLFLGDTIPNHVGQGSHSDWVLTHDFSSWINQSPLMAWSLKLGTLMVTILEIATPFALISKRIRYAVLLIMPLFHLGAMVMFKVVFIEQPLALILLIHLTPMLESAGEQTKRRLIAFRKWFPLSGPVENPARQSESS